MLHAGVYGYAGADGRPFAAASVKHGIVVGEASLVTLPTHTHSEDGRPHPAADNKVCPCFTWFRTACGPIGQEKLLCHNHARCSLTGLIDPLPLSTLVLPNMQPCLCDPTNHSITAASVVADQLSLIRRDALMLNFICKAGLQSHHKRIVLSCIMTCCQYSLERPASCTVYGVWTASGMHDVMCRAQHSQPCWVTC